MAGWTPEGQDDEAALWSELMGLTEAPAYRHAFQALKVELDGAEGALGDREEGSWAVWDFWVESQEVDMELGVDFARYRADAEGELTGDDEHVCLELLFALNLPKRGHYASAIQRVCRALAHLPPDARGGGLAPIDFPNTAPLDRGVYLLDHGRGAQDSRQIWLAVRARPVRRSEVATWRDVLDRGRADLLELAERASSVVLTAHGAIWGADDDRFSRDVVTGWLGEAVAHRELVKRWPELRPGAAWHAPYDLEAGEDRFEVKATTDKARGRITLSPDELRLAMELRERWHLVRVEIDAEVVDRVYGWLNEARLRPGAEAPADVLPPIFWRLVQATRLQAGHVAALWPELEDAVASLAPPPPECCEPDALGWLGDAGGKLADRQAGLTLPFTP